MGMKRLLLYRNSPLKSLLYVWVLLSLKFGSNINVYLASCKKEINTNPSFEHPLVMIVCLKVKERTPK